MQQHLTSRYLRLALPALAIILSLLACNLPLPGSSAQNSTGTAQAATETEQALREQTGTLPPTQTLGAATPSETPLPSETPGGTATLALTATPTGPTYSVGQAVNCRYGPSTGFEIRSTLAVGSTVPIIGRSNTAYWSNWWKVVYSGSECWVSDGFGSLSGDLTGVPVYNIATFTPTVTPSITPTSTVTYTPTVTVTSTP